ncbi:MAG TPA: hypothetical protein VK203_23235 [Nostocaceae cyanobacterium]|nr:hypothetical protein [Nostocaceae cyanobacterium]
MKLIKEIVQEALATGYLDAQEQNQIRMLLQSNYDSEDLDAYIILQRAIAAGEVHRESNSQKSYSSSKSRETSANIKLAYKIAAEMAFAAAMALSISQNAQDQPFLGT